MSYKDLSDEDKLSLAIGFVANDQPLPEALKEFLVASGMYELITKPMKQNDG